MDPYALQAIISTLLLVQMQSPNGVTLKPEHLKQEGIAQKQQIVRNAKKRSREQKQTFRPRQNNRKIQQAFPRNFRRSR